MSRNTRSQRKQVMRQEAAMLPNIDTSLTYYDPRTSMPAPGFYATTEATGTTSMLAGYDPYAVAPPFTLPRSPMAPSALSPTMMSPINGMMQLPLPPQHRASSGAWTLAEDEQLLTARAKGANWAKISERFDGKSANACRKRHERLMEKNGENDFDARRMERMAKEYMSLRKEIWTPLANRTGEKWNVVEQKCMSNGLKNIQTAARAYNRRERLEQNSSQQSHLMVGYDTDTNGTSSLGGIDLAPVEHLEVGHPSATYPPLHLHNHHHRSPDRSSTSSHGHGRRGGSSGGSSATSAHTATNYVAATNGNAIAHVENGYAYDTGSNGMYGNGNSVTTAGQATSTTAMGHHRYHSSVNSIDTSLYAPRAGDPGSNDSPFDPTLTRMANGSMEIDALLEAPRLGI